MGKGKTKQVQHGQPNHNTKPAKSASIKGQSISIDPHYKGGELDINTNGDFFNMVMAGLATPKKSFLNFLDNKTSHFWLRKFRKDMMGATKMYLSKNFMETAVELSFSYPKYINQMLPRAIPCLDNIWIEWNEGDRYDATQKVFKKMGANGFDNPEAASRNDTGYLIRKSPASGFEYSCIFPSSFEGKATLFFPALSWHFNNDPDKSFKTEQLNNVRLPQGLPLIDHATDVRNRTDILKALWGRDYCILHEENEVEASILNPWKFNVQMGIHDLGYCAYPELYSNREDNRLASMADKIHLGDMRFLMAVFSLLNYPRYVRIDSPAPKKLNRIKWGRTLPRNEIKVIEVELPKTNGVNLYKQLYTGHGTPKRQHERRGHPRRYRDAQGRIIKTIWIDPQVVGNAELGRIDHEYFLKHKSEKYQGKRAPK